LQVWVEKSRFGAIFGVLENMLVRYTFLSFMPLFSSRNTVLRTNYELYEFTNIRNDFVCVQLKISEPRPPNMLISISFCMIRWVLNTYYRNPEKKPENFFRNFPCKFDLTKWIQDDWRFSGSWWPNQLILWWTYLRNISFGTMNSTKQLESMSLSQSWQTFEKVRKFLVLILKHDLYFRVANK
jgi:hypothetical protein